MMLKKLLILIFCTLFILQYSKVMANEEAKYEIIDKNKVYEIRKYSDRLFNIFNTSTCQHFPYYTRPQHFQHLNSQHFHISTLNSTFKVEGHKSNVNPVTGDPFESTCQRWHFCGLPDCRPAVIP